jgi:hypothetical protein
MWEAAVLSPENVQVGGEGAISFILLPSSRVQFHSFSCHRRPERTCRAFGVGNNTIEFFPFGLLLLYSMGRRPRTSLVWKFTSEHFKWATKMLPQETRWNRS